MSEEEQMWQEIAAENDLEWEGVDVTDKDDMAELHEILGIKGVAQKSRFKKFLKVQQEQQYEAPLPEDDGLVYDGEPLPEDDGIAYDEVEDDGIAYDNYEEPAYDEAPPTSRYTRSAEPEEEETNFNEYPGAEEAEVGSVYHEYSKGWFPDEADMAKNYGTGEKPTLLA
mmetsp:Transcript_20098/g.30218  ORF Transcript_20098/g.30218 Transcript_20098/m.30218 type:complete len:169 (-) Transcript_20098:66-572(-)